MSWSNTEGGSHGGEDWIISENTTVGGTHTLVGRFKVNSGVTATITDADPDIGGISYFTVYCVEADIQGIIEGNEKGLPGGAGGAGGDGGSVGQAGDAGTKGGYYPDSTHCTGSWPSQCAGGPGVGGGYATHAGTGNVGGDGGAARGAGGIGGDGADKEGGTGGWDDAHAAQLYLDTGLAGGGGCGGGGGGGGGNSAGSNGGTAGNGGNGGGHIWITATRKIVNTGTMRCNGGQGGNGGNGGNGGAGTVSNTGAGGGGGGGNGGGGGSGGGMIMQTLLLDNSSGTLSVAAGNGGDGGDGGNGGYDADSELYGEGGDGGSQGGGGSPGRMKLFTGILTATYRKDGTQNTSIGYGGSVGSGGTGSPNGSSGASSPYPNGAPVNAWKCDNWNEGGGYPAAQPQYLKANYQPGSKNYTRRFRMNFNLDGES